MMLSAKYFLSSLLLAMTLVARTESQPDEVLFPSESPYSEVPTFSNAPISGAPVSGCRNPSDHYDVLDELSYTFGQDNCQMRTSTMNCEAKAFGYTASANYEWESQGDLNYPVELTVSSTYTDPEVDPEVGDPLISSFMEWIYFEEECLEDTHLEDTHLSSIWRVLNERSCPNKSGSFAFRGDQEYTCLELAGLRWRKRKRVCASETYTDFGENCRGVCRTGEYCQWVDNPVAFPVGRKGKTMTCQEVAEWDDAKKAKKCRRTKFQENCPSACSPVT